MRGEGEQVESEGASPLLLLSSPLLTSKFRILARMSAASFCSSSASAVRASRRGCRVWEREVRGRMRRERRACVRSLFPRPQFSHLALGLGFRGHGGVARVRAYVCVCWEQRLDASRGRGGARERKSVASKKKRFLFALPSLLLCGPHCHSVTRRATLSHPGGTSRSTARHQTHFQPPPPPITRRDCVLFRTSPHSLFFSFSLSKWSTPGARTG